MSLSPAALLSIQQAGQGLHAARQAVADAVQTNAERVVAYVASQPFSPENDLAYTKLRSAARLSHELQAMEEQLKVLYISAAELMTPESPILVALPNHGGHARPRAVKSNEGAEDAIVKPTASSLLKRQNVKSGQPQRLSHNDEKVLGYLKSVLDRRSWKSLTQATIAKMAGIPVGSVGLALRRLVAGGAVREGNKGTYRLL
ncbi:MAG: hypothetical protein HHJ16_08440 [Polaromonas sp.]|uniref:hypothetical protein n=1 Tax=Polaromonas sp. TaxID=1869339 RepID=UPI00185C0C95|nr:hypothetical protein [Polaromonas sp.]NMM10286.1 hypothetical protein [Polaromonas sp.]